MKIFLLVILSIVVITTAQSQWKSMGNCDRLLVSKTQIKNFAITEDSKFIYTLDDSNVIKKFDYVTGDSIWEKKIEGYQIFFSSDGNTYCTSSEINTGYEVNYNIKIINLESSDLIDSLIIKPGLENEP